MECLPKQYKKAYKASSKVGWSWTKRQRHIEVRDASGEFVVMISSTQYDGVLTKKVLSTLRKAGCPQA